MKHLRTWALLLALSALAPVRIAWARGLRRKQSPDEHRGLTVGTVASLSTLVAKQTLVKELAVTKSKQTYAAWEAIVTMQELAVSLVQSSPLWVFFVHLTTSLRSILQRQAQPSTVTVPPVQQSSGNRDCDSAIDVIRHLRENNRSETLYAYIFEFLFFIVLVIGLSIYAGRKVKPVPPRYWSSAWGLGWGIHRLQLFFDDSYHYETDVTSEMGTVMQQLFDMTTEKEKMGMGRDGSWATHRAFKVLKVVRIEDGKLWTGYTQIRNAINPTDSILGLMPQALQTRAKRAIEICQEYKKRWNSGEVSDFLSTLKLDSSRNEILLFHGSPGEGARDQNGDVRYNTEETSPVYAIKHQGFDDRLGSVHGMFGSGIYFANMASKADCYAGIYHDNASRALNGTVGEHATIFVSRVTMGAPYLTDQSLEQLRRPPCVEGHFDLNLHFNEEVQIGKPWREKGVEFSINDRPRFNSVIGDYDIDGARKLYREFIVYDKQCYPEFVVVYERTQHTETSVL